MGMHADDALDECWVMDELRDKFLRGDMTSAEADDHGIYDECGPMAKRCRCCGKSGLVWGTHDGRWRLFERDKLHRCPVNPLRKAGK